MSNIILNSNTTIMCIYSMCLWVDTGSQVENWDTLDILEFFPPTFIDLSSRFRSILKYENLDRLKSEISKLLTFRFLP